MPLTIETNFSLKIPGLTHQGSTHAAHTGLQAPLREAVMFLTIKKGTPLRAVLLMQLAPSFT